MIYVGVVVNVSREECISRVNVTVDFGFCPFFQYILFTRMATFVR